MALPKTLNDREYQKFIEDEDGRVAINVKLKDATITGNVDVDVAAFKDAAGDPQDALVDADGRQYSYITDGTSEVDVITQDAAFGTAAKGLPLFGKYQATPTTYADGDAAPILLDENGRIVLEADVQIGAVEIKNATTDDRAVVNAANTARSATDNVVLVQTLDAAGNVGSSATDVDDTAFTPATDKGQVIMAVQTADVVDAGDKGALRMTMARELMVNSRIAGDGFGTYANRRGDFIATPTTGAKTITVTGLPFTLEAEHVLQVRKRTSAGVEMTLPLTTITVSGGVITLADAPNFVAGDVVSVLLEGAAKTYDRSLDIQKTVNQSPDRASYVIDSLIDTTNVAIGTAYLPSSTGMSMDGFKDLSISGKLIDADGTVTVTIEATDDEDSTNADWVQVYYYDNKNNTTVNTWTVTNDTLTFAGSLDNFNYNLFRVKVVQADSATNTQIIKIRRKAL